MNVEQEVTKYFANNAKNIMNVIRLAVSLVKTYFGNLKGSKKRDKEKELVAEIITALGKLVPEEARTALEDALKVSDKDLNKLISLVEKETENIIDWITEAISKCGCCK